MSFSGVKRLITGTQILSANNAFIIALDTGSSKVDTTLLIPITTSCVTGASTGASMYFSSFDGKLHILVVWAGIRPNFLRTSFKLSINI